MRCFSERPGPWQPPKQPRFRPRIPLEEERPPLANGRFEARKRRTRDPAKGSFRGPCRGKVGKNPQIPAAGHRDTDFEHGADLLQNGAF